MRRSALFSTMALASTTLAACSTAGTNGGPPLPPPPGPQVYADTAGSASTALSNGSTLQGYESGMVTSLAHNFEAGATEAITPLSFAVSTNAAGGVDVTVGDQSFSFSDGDKGQWGWKAENEQTFYEATVWSNDPIDDVMDPSNPSHHQIWGYWWDDGSGTSNTGFAAVGTEARPEALDGKAEATYTGLAGGAITNAGSFDNTERFLGDLTMLANFDSGEISGEITDLRLEGNNILGTVQLQLGNINGTGFSGTVVVSQELLTAFNLDTLAGNYSGKFFGPNAQEIAGVLSVAGENTTTDSQFVGTGFLSGRE